MIKKVYTYTKAHEIQSMKLYIFGILIYQTQYNHL